MKDRIAVDQDFPLASASLPSSSAPLNSFSNCRPSGSSDHSFVVALGETMAFVVVMDFVAMVAEVVITALGVMALEVMTFVALVLEEVMTALGVMLGMAFGPNSFGVVPPDWVVLLLHRRVPQVSS